MSKVDNSEKNVLHAIYSKKTFLKVKQWLESGQMIFSFVEKQTKKSIDIYFTADEMMLFCDKILNGTIKANVDKAGGNQAKPGYTSPYGGNATGNNGSPISRYFIINKGSVASYLIKAIVFPANKTDIGAFIPIEGEKSLNEICVPVGQEDLYLLARKWRYLQEDYYRSTYRVENMKSSFQPNTQDLDETSNPMARNKTLDSVSKKDEASKESSNTKSSTPSVEIKSFTKRVVSDSLLVPMDKYPGCFTMAIKVDGKKENVIFLKDNIEKTDNTLWSNFSNHCKGRSKVTFYANFVKRGKAVYFNSFAE